MANGFQLLLRDANLQCVQKPIINFSVNAEAIIKEEILAGNYVITPQKPAIINALDAVPKPDSDAL